MKEKLEDLLSELADATKLPPRRGLSDEIKGRIPANLLYHSQRKDSYNIMIDLRISKIAAAAIITITLILSAGYFGAADSAGGSIFRDSKVMLRYVLGGNKGKTALASGSMEGIYQRLVATGKDVVYYGEKPDLQDKDAIIMQWKISDNKYSVVFGDLSVKTVNAEELVRLQSKMLRK